MKYKCYRFSRRPRVTTFSWRTRQTLGIELKTHDKLNVNQASSVVKVYVYTSQHRANKFLQFVPFSRFPLALPERTWVSG